MKSLTKNLQYRPKFTDIYIEREYRDGRERRDRGIEIWYMYIYTRTHRHTHRERERERERDFRLQNIYIYISWISSIVRS